MKKYLFIVLCCFSWVSLALAEELIIEPDMGRTPILSALHQAHHSVQLVMYGITDPILISAVIQAKNQGKNVQILLEPHPYRNEGENLYATQQFQHATLNSKPANPSFKLTHQKTLVLDQQKAIVMTFNFTRSTFSKERNFGLIITDPAIIQEIHQVFQADWEHKNVAVNHPNLVWSPHNSREKISRLIQSAKSDIKIYAQSLTDYRMIGLLAKTARTGVPIEILLADNPSNQHSRKLDYLKRAGVTIHFSQQWIIHAKVIIVDHHRAELGSINLTQPSLDRNRELAVLIDNSAIIKQLEKTFEQDFKRGMVKIE